MNAADGKQGKWVKHPKRYICQIVQMESQGNEQVSEWNKIKQDLELSK
jgi:hypothetical protein